MLNGYESDEYAKMAGQKSLRTKDDRAKKRKRDLNENDSRSKRQRAERKESKANGRKSEASLSSSAKGIQPETNGLNGALSTVEATGDRQLQVVRQFNDGEAGWRVSKPMGGRMLDIDPILTADDQ